MSQSLRLEYLDPAELAANPLNPKFHPPEQLQAVQELVSDVGWAGALLFNEATGRLLDGHGRKELFEHKGPVPVLIGSWNEAQEKKILAFLDPTSYMARIDRQALDLLAAGDDLLDGASAVFAELLDSMRAASELMAPAADQAPADVVADPGQGDGSGGGEGSSSPPRRHPAADVPDALWPSNDDWGIPLLDLALQADSVEFPVTLWGSQGQTRAMRGTWVFYANDSVFEPLWSNPGKVLTSGAPCLVEPNYSTHEQSPFAVELWGIYRRRWLARYWQSQGRRVFVDLNVHHRLLEPHPAVSGNAPAFLGVPRGWRAFASRAHGNRPEMLEAEHDAALTHSGEGSILFLVYGGGKRVKDMARERGWVWVPEQNDVKGRNRGAQSEHASE
jgi:hypothetical protein